MLDVTIAPVGRSRTITKCFAVEGLKLVVEALTWNAVLGLVAGRVHGQYAVPVYDGPV
jgi:hypothetical protein